MTFAMDNDDDGSQSGSRPTAHAPQHATTILNKSFIHDKTVDMTANFHQEEEDDEKQLLNSSRIHPNAVPSAANMAPDQQSEE